ncbi:MAG: hypothetical protein H6737_10655 [Alphaproteobacteria bacterium]|nr:hypothetical protein [Alphaproteobacteria bacterium]
MWVAIVALTGCSWLMDVPEERVPERSSAQSGNRVANQVEGADYKDPTMRSQLTTELNTGEGVDGSNGGATASGTSGGTRWEPVSRPVEPKEEKPFVFQTSTGTRIKSTGTPSISLDGYPTAAELNITEEKRREMIATGELVRRK